MENRCAYDESLQFHAESRRIRLMGLGATSLLGVAEAGAYAQDLVFSTLEGKASHEIATKLRHDFDAAGADASTKRRARSARRRGFAAMELAFVNCPPGFRFRQSRNRRPADCACLVF
nr:ATPase inhibitor subunit zeta [Rhizobium sp. CF080]